MKKNIILPYFITLFFIPAFSQQSDLAIPLDILPAYVNQTRSTDGKPGPNYWQNSADYQINVTVVPNERRIRGEATITYQNNSPDSLRLVYFRLYPNLYQKGNVRDYAIDTIDVHRGVNIEQLKANNVEVEMVITGTILLVNLNETLLPGQSVEFNINWNFTLPTESTIRHGEYLKNEFFVAYWYPQICVYDDVDGWDIYQYSGAQEFYNEFADYDVRVNVPENFIVWATGEIQNPQEVLREDIYQKYLEARNSQEVFNILQEEDYLQGSVTQKQEQLTYHFKAQNVTDFAFGTSDHYIWDGSRLNLDDGRSVFIDAAYRPESADFYEVAEIARNTIEYLSTEIPGVPYPYPEMTVFNGGGGMEFPMMCNDVSVSSRQSAVSLTAHEIAHTYFPFYMGINEKKYAWMDEGWARKLPAGIQSKLAKGFDPIARTTEAYEAVAGTELEVPVITPTIAISGIHVYRPTLRNNAYYKSGTAYHMLHLMLGDTLFKKALREFIKIWHGKHPLPYDFFYSINEAVGENLNWFWQSWFYQTGFPDLAIKSATQDGDTYVVEIEKKGSIPLPIKLTFRFSDGSEQIVEENLSIWKNQKTTHTIKTTLKKSVSYMLLGDNHIPDINENNNLFEF